MSHVNAETIRWAYRLLLDREPEDENVVKKHFLDIPDLRKAILGSLEYRIKNAGMVLASDTWVIKETVHGFRIWLSLAELAVSRPILHDAYDVREVEILKTIVKKGDTAFDIGTNIGFYSNLLSKLVGPTGHVVGFEPLRYLYDKATASVRENHFQDFCTVHNLALSNTEGAISIRHAPITANFGGGHIAPDSNTPKDHVDEKVNVSKLDRFLPKSTVNFIKIDVEGAEPMVIEGGRKLLARDRPTILAELHNAQLKLVSNSNSSQLIQQMNTLGYLCFAVGDTNRSQPMESYDSSHPVNVLFVSKA